MISIVERLKIFLIGIIAFLLFIFGYKKGIEREENKKMKGNLNAVEKVKKARDSLSDDNVTGKLHKRYRRKR